MAMGIHSRRIAVAICFIGGAALAIGGAIVGQLVLSVSGLVGCLLAVGFLSVMLSRQVMWGVGEIRSAVDGIKGGAASIERMVRDGDERIVRGQRSVSTRVNGVTEALAGEMAALRKRLDAVSIEMIASCSVANARQGEALELRLDGRFERARQEGHQEVVELRRSIADVQEDVRSVHGLQREAMTGVSVIADTLRGDMASNSNLVLRTYQEMVESDESQLLSIDSLAAQVREVQAGLDDRGEALVRIESELKAVEQDRASIKNLAGDEKRLRSISRLALQWLKSETVQEVEALIQLRALLKVNDATPLLGGWAMDAAAVYRLLELVRERDIRKVVELGSGSSTVWIALALKGVAGASIMSFDHLQEYGDATARHLHRLGLESIAKVEVVALVPIRIEGRDFDWYDLSSPSVGPIDLLIVDGPPGGTGPMARYPAVPRLAKCLSPDTLIVVDDLLRRDEMEMLREWKLHCPSLEEVATLGARTRVYRVGEDVEALQDWAATVQ